MIWVLPAFPQPKLKGVWQPARRDYTLVCRAHQATLLGLFEEFNVESLPLEDILRRLGINEATFDKLFESMFNTALLLRNNDNQIAINDAYNEQVKTIDLTVKMAEKVRVVKVQETVETVKKNRLLYLKPAVLRILKSQATSPSQAGYINFQLG